MQDLRSVSGGMEGRPIFEYISSKSGDNSFSCSSASALILRAGIFNRHVGKGPHGIIPFGIETAILENVKPEPMLLDVQSLHTADDFACNICIAVEYEIIDLKKHELDYENTPALIHMLCAGVVSQRVHAAKFKTIKEDDWLQKLKAPFNRIARKRGVRITEIALQDFSNGTASRHWHEGIDLDIGGE